MINRENETLPSGIDWYETSLMDEDHLYYDQICIAETVGFSISDIALHVLFVGIQSMLFEDT